MPGTADALVAAVAALPARDHQLVGHRDRAQHPAGRAGAPVARAATCGSAWRTCSPWRVASPSSTTTQLVARAVELGRLAQRTPMSGPRPARCWAWPELPAAESAPDGSRLTTLRRGRPDRQPADSDRDAGPRPDQARRRRGPDQRADRDIRLGNVSSAQSLAELDLMSRTSTSSRPPCAGPGRQPGPAADDPGRVERVRDATSGRWWSRRSLVIIAGRRSRSRWSVVAVVAYVGSARASRDQLGDPTPIARGDPRLPSRPSARRPIRPTERRPAPSRTRRTGPDGGRASATSWRPTGSSSAPAGSWT